jgi:hypothetical protein
MYVRSLVRCSQPMVGASGDRCDVDERLAMALRLQDIRNMQHSVVSD